MLGIAILFFLVIWIAITLLAMWIGWWLGCFGGKLKTKVFGAFLGFMLTMGGFITYWTIEYIYTQMTVTTLCKEEGGLTIYVTPEEWQKQIGEKEWNRMKEIDKGISCPETKKEIIIFQGKEYKPFGQINPRVISLKGINHSRKNIGETDFLYYDTVSKTVLYRKHTFGVGTPAIANDIKGLKFWLNNVNGCDSSTLTEGERLKVYNEYTNHSIKN